MAWLPIPGIGEIGVLRPEEVSCYEAPPNAWTKAENVCFRNGYITRAEVLSPIPAFTTVASPYGLFGYVPDLVNVGEMAVVTTLAKAYSYSWETATSADITRAAGDYTGAASNTWSFEFFNGYVLATNGVDLPQYYVPEYPYTTHKFSDLTNWQAGYKACVLRGFLNFLVALGVTPNGSSFKPRMIKWSHGADTGQLPASWDQTDATKDAGEIELRGNADAVLELKPLGDNYQALVYTGTGMWVMRYVGPPAIFAFEQRSSYAGAWGPRAVASIPGRRQVFCSGDDVILTDGNTLQSIASGKVRRYLVDNMVGNGQYGARLVVDNIAKEVGVFVPTAGSTAPDYFNSALWWNWESGTWRTNPTTSFSDLCTLDIAFINIQGHASGGGGTGWTYTNRPLALASAARSIYYMSGLGNVTLEREGWAPAVVGQTIAQDHIHRKLLKKIRPRIEFATSGGQMTIAVSGKNRPHESYSTPVSQTITANQADPFECDFNVEGRYFKVTYTATDAVAWKLTSIEVEIDNLGEY